MSLRYLDKMSSTGNGRNMILFENPWGLRCKEKGSNPAQEPQTSVKTLMGIRGQKLEKFPSRYRQKNGKNGTPIV